MTRRRFHIVLALTLVACALCPYVEGVIHWDQTIFDTGYDGESTVAVVALLLILAFVLVKLLVQIVLENTSGEPLVDSKPALGFTLDFISSLRDPSPPPPLRI